MEDPTDEDDVDEDVDDDDDEPIEDDTEVDDDVDDVDDDDTYKSFMIICSKSIASSSDIAIAIVD